MKKKTALCLALSAALLAGCGSGTDTAVTETPTPESTQTVEVTPEPTKTPEPEPAELRFESPNHAVGDIGDYHVEVTGFHVSAARTGDNVLIMEYNFTNNSDKTMSPYSALYMIGFQDGVQMDSFIADSSIVDYGIAQKQLRPGASMEGCQATFILYSDSSVEVEIHAGYNGPMMTEVFNVNANIENREPENQSESVKNSSLMFDLLMISCESALEKSWGNDFEIEYDDTGLTINTWRDGIATNTVLASQGNKTAKDNWEKLIDSQKTLCNVLLEQIKDTGKEDYIVVLNILNDLDKNKVLLSVLNGTVIYDSVND